MIKEVLTSVWKKNIWALASLGMLLTFSCQDDMLAERQQLVKGDEIVFVVDGDSVQTMMSRSEKSMSRQFIAMIGNDSVFLQVVEENNQELFFTPKANDARSASFNQDNLNSFNLFAYLNDKAEFMVDQLVTKTGGKWSYSPVKYWPNNKTDFISFYGYAMKNNKGTITDFSIDRATRKGSFTYALPETDSDDKEDAENQPDLIFAITPEQKKENSGAVNLSFNHALSAILFKMGNMPKGVKITDIAVKSVSTSGDCIYSMGEDGMEFTWTGQNNEGNYIQTFNKTKTSESNEPELISGDDQLFMMIPQELDKAFLEISFQVGEKIHVLQCPLNLEGFPQKWVANKKYTYVIATAGLVDVEVEDKCTPTVKSDVKIQNTGFADAYIRAAIVGYWVNEQGDVVASWDAEDAEVGTFQNLATNLWFKGQDGFYYYKNLVSPTEYTSPLFDRYELKENPPIVGSSLEFSIVVQAVEIGQAASAWTNVKVENGSLTNK